MKQILRSFGKYKVNGIDSKNLLGSIYHFEMKCTDKIGDVHCHKLQNCGGTIGDWTVNQVMVEIYQL